MTVMEIIMLIGFWMLQQEVLTATARMLKGPKGPATFAAEKFMNVFAIKKKYL